MANRKINRNLSLAQHTLLRRYAERAMGRPMRAAYLAAESLVREYGETNAVRGMIAKRPDAVTREIKGAPVKRNVQGSVDAVAHMTTENAMIAAAKSINRKLGNRAPEDTPATNKRVKRVANLAKKELKRK